MKPIRLFTVTDDNGAVCVMAADFFERAGLSPEEAFGEEGRWVTVEIAAPTHALQQKINQAALVPDANLGFRVDTLKLPAARAAAMVKSWTNVFREDGTCAPPGDLTGVHPNLANAVDEAIQARMYPSIFANETFLKALAAKAETQGPGESPNPQGSDSSAGSTPLPNG